MNTSRDDDINVPSMVPERDELASRGGRRGVSSTSSTAGRSRRPAGPAKASSAVRFLLSILVIGMLATAGVAYLFYTEGQKALTELEEANGRLLSLENRLSAVGENTEETTLNLVERIDFNFSEIDKLWAARNQNRQNIAANKTGLESQAEAISIIETALQSQAGMLNTANAQLTSMQNRIDSIASNIANLDNFNQQLSGISQELNQIRSSVNILQSVEGRVDIAEQDIESINVYRLQLNQTVNNMQNQINSLQSRVSP